MLYFKGLGFRRRNKLEAFCHRKGRRSDFHYRKAHPNRPEKNALPNSGEVDGRLFFFFFFFFFLKKTTKKHKKVIVQRFQLSIIFFNSIKHYSHRSISQFEFRIGTEAVGLDIVLHHILTLSTSRLPIYQTSPIPPLPIGQYKI